MLSREIYKRKQFQVSKSNFLWKLHIRVLWNDSKDEQQNYIHTGIDRKLRCREMKSDPFDNIQKGLKCQKKVSLDDLEISHEAPELQILLNIST